VNSAPSIGFCLCAVRDRLDFKALGAGGEHQACIRCISEHFIQEVRD
jgi:hypothetical protein